jgi:hypothetical protein
MLFDTALTLLLLAGVLFLYRGPLASWYNLVEGEDYAHRYY